MFSSFMGPCGSSTVWKTTSAGAAISTSLTTYRDLMEDPISSAAMTLLLWNARHEGTKAQRHEVRKDRSISPSCLRASVASCLYGLMQRDRARHLVLLFARRLP